MLSQRAQCYLLLGQSGGRVARTGAGPRHVPHAGSQAGQRLPDARGGDDRCGHHRALHASHRTMGCACRPGGSRSWPRCRSSSRTSTCCHSSARRSTPNGPPRAARLKPPARRTQEVVCLRHGPAGAVGEAQESNLPARHVCAARLDVSKHVRGCPSGPADHRELRCPQQPGPAPQGRRHRATRLKPPSAPSRPTRSWRR